MPRQPGYRISLDSKQNIEQALKKKELTYRADNRIIEALEQENVFIIPKTWQRFWEGKQNIDRTTFEDICEFLGLDWRDIVLPSQMQDRPALLPSDLVPSEPVPSNLNFYGRKQELCTLQEWVADNRCRLVILYGLYGMGKSSLVKQLTKQVDKSFQKIKWKTFSYGDSVESTLIDLLQQLEPQNSFRNLSLQQLKDRLFLQLQAHRYLIILVQVQDERFGKYNDYKKLLCDSINLYSGDCHQSCILLISSYEKPDGVTAMANDKSAVRSYRLAGVDPEAGEKILENKDKRLLIDIEAAAKLVNRYQGYPLALKYVASHICNCHDGNVREFLSKPSPFILSNIDNILKELIKDLEKPARTILNILKDSEAISQAQIEEVYRKQIPDVRDFTTALDILERRSLLIRSTGDTDYGPEGFFGLEEVTKQCVRRYFSTNI